MRLSTYSTDGVARFGAVVDYGGTDKILDLTPHLPDVADLSDLLTRGCLDEAQAITNAVAITFLSARENLVPLPD